MIRAGRFSIGVLMAVVSLVAADCAILRASWESWLAWTLILLPMLNAMLFGALELRKGRGSRPFWWAFEVVGATMAGLISLALWYDYLFVLHPVLWLYQNKWLSGERTRDLVLVCLCVVGIYTPPQLLVAVAAGWLSARYRVVIVRRPRAVEGSHPGLTMERTADSPEAQATGDDNRRAVAR